MLAVPAHHCYCGPEPILKAGDLPVASGEAGTAQSIVYGRIEVSCACGRRPTRLRDVGLTVDLRRQLYRVRPLAECWRECPEAAPVSRAGVHDSTQSIEIT